MANTQYNIIGAVTENSAIISSKLDFPAPLPTDTELKILKLRYHKDFGYKIYINNELVSTDTARTGNFSYIENLMIGGDADDVDFFNGYLAELVIVNDIKNSTAIDNNIQAQERFLIDKWLTKGTVMFDGYVAGDSPTNPFPMEMGLPDRLRWLHFNETSYTTDINDKCTQINDFVGYGQVVKHGVPTAGATFATVEKNKYKGKDVLYFDGNSNYKVTGLMQSGDPDFFTLLMVFAFKNTLGNQTVIGAINNNNDSYNNAIRIKKYESDSYLDCRINTSGFSYGQVPFNLTYTVGYPSNQILGTSKIKYSKSLNFSDSIITISKTLNSSENGVAKHKLVDLDNDTQYYAKVLIDDIEINEVLKFKTFPIAGTPTSFKFIAGSCNYTGSNAETFEEIKNENPLFWAHLGDWHYDDIGVNDIQLFRNAFAQTAKQERIRNLNNNVPLAYMWDDHDYGVNNSDKNSASKVASTNFYLENIPHYPFLNNNNSNPLTDTIGQSWIVGRVLFIMTDLRSQRDYFLMDDYDVNKKMMGDVQKQWFKNTLLSTKNNDSIGLICWLNPGSWTGEDLDPYSWDYGTSGEHWTAYKAERTELWNWMNDNNITNMFIVQGDTHQVAIDDGRNAIFDTLYPTTLNYKDFKENRLTPIIEASPYEQAIDRGSGQFQINDIGDSGSVGVLSEKTYSTFEIEDVGTEWIKVIVKQYCLPDGLTYYTEKTLVNSFEFVRQTKGIKAEKPDLNNNTGLSQLKGKIKTDLILNKKSAPITFISPTTFKNNYKGAITGKINANKENRLVRVYRRSDEDYEVGECEVNATTGEFTFTGNKGISQLVFKIYNTTNNALIDEIINDGENGDVYRNVEAQLFVTSDIDYYQYSNTVGVNNGYSFDVNDTENKSYKVKIVDKTTNEILAETPIKGWLPRSYTLELDDPAYFTPFASKSYLYDAGLSLIAFSGKGKQEDAKRTAKGIIKSQFENGSFPFSTSHINPTGADTYLRSGAICWVAYALGYYLLTFPNSSIKKDVEDTVNKVLNYLITLQDNTKGGLIKGGSCRYTTTGRIETFSN